MTISEKIEELKLLVNWDLSQFTKETLVYPYDFKRAVEYALRCICKISRAWEKTVYFPIVNKQRLFSLDPTLYIKEKVEFVRATGIGYYNNSYCHLPSVNLETIDINRQVDFEGIAQQIRGSDFLFKLNKTLDTLELGVFDKILTVPTDTTITVANSVAEGDTVSNLTKAENNEWFQAVNLTAGTTPEFAEEIKNSPYNWTANDVIYSSTGKPVFLVICFQTMPKYFYFDSETVIPIIPSLIDSIDSYAVSHLYSILIARDATQDSKRKYDSLITTGKIRRVRIDENEDTRVKQLTKDLKVAVVQSYLPYKHGTKYGR